MSTAKRTKKKAARAPKTPPENAKPRWPMEERKVDPDAPYYGLSKEEFERLAFWRKIPLSPETERWLDWMIVNRRRIRSGSLEPYDDSPLKRVPNNGESF